MKKIGILTHPLKDNYGGILQSIALYHYLEMAGYEVVLLRKHRYRAAWKNAIIKSLEWVPFQNIRGYKSLAKKKKIQAPFIDKYLPSKTTVLHTREELKNAVEALNLDAIVVGSDQVWRMSSIDDGYYGCYFLDFVNSNRVRKISYAASFGTEEWGAPEVSKSVASLLSDFYAVSVRESSGITICKNEFGVKKVEHVLDPTLLINKDFYNSFLSSGKRGGGLVSYILDDDPEVEKFELSLMDAVASVEDIKRINGNGTGKIYNLEEWLSEFLRADFVVTDSFHGMVFSIIFQKSFIVLGNKKRGMARFESLLRDLGLMSRLVRLTEQEKLQTIAQQDINYNHVSTKLECLKKKSENFLLNNLS